MMYYQKNKYNTPERITYELPCPYCGADVFYYEKKHASGRTSKVFFDALGKPWPRHRCREYLNPRRNK